MENINAEKRRWLIIEDYPKRAEYLMDNISKYYPDEDIIWFYAYNDDFIDTFQLDIDDGDYGKSGPLKRNFRTRKGENKNIKFYWHKYKKDFRRDFKKEAKEGNQILLLDVSLKLFGNNHSVDPFLKPLKEFQKQDNSLITIVSTAANPQVQARLISDNKNVTWGDHLYEKGKTFYEDCEEVVIHSDKKWQEIHKDWQLLPLFSEKNESSYMKLMSEWTQHDCHVNSYGKLAKENKLCPQYGIPKCRVWLMRVLNYLNCDDFKQDFNKAPCEKGDFPFNLIECLKTFGTKDSHNISPLSLLLITFANFRKTFHEELKNRRLEFVKINQQFIKAISYQTNKDKNEITKFKRIIREGSVSPLQQYETRVKTWETFSKMIQELIVNAPNKKQCNIEAIEINHENINIHFKNIDAEELRKKIDVVYLNRINSPDPMKGHTTSQAIIKYLIQSAKPDYPPLAGHAFVGADHKLKISPKPDNDGIIITF